MAVVLYFTSVDSLASPVPQQPPPQHGFFVKIHSLQSSELELYGFVLKKLFTHFEMLIVSHAPHCVNGHCFVFYLF